MASRRTFECPVCGGEVPLKAKSCHHCGACEKTGWNEDTSSADGLDLPDDDFDYEKFTQREFGTRPKSQGIKLIWWITALVLLVVTSCLAIYDMLFGAQ